jgi:hypothetical protein
MVGRDGGKAKPLKQPKKADKVVLDEDIEYKKKMVCLNSLRLQSLYRLRRRRRSLQLLKRWQRSRSFSVDE